MLRRRLLPALSLIHTYHARILWSLRDREPKPIRRGLKLGFLATLGTVILLAAVLVVLDKQRHADSPILSLGLWAVGLFVGVVIGRRTAAAERRRYRRLHGLCEGCGYNLTGNTSGACPECGSAISRAHQPAASG